MKKLISLLLILTIGVGISMGQTKEIRTVGTFTKISFRVPGKLVLRQGAPQKVELEGDKEALAKIETELKGDKLIIGNEERWNWSWREVCDRRSFGALSNWLGELNLLGL